MRVLLLEDDAELRNSFARRLRADGHAVDEAALLEGARAALAEHRFDCLVLDRFVPDGDADLVATLGRTGEHPPVIFVSAFGEADHRIDGLDVGADDYLSKPVRLDELSLRVRRVAARQSVKDREGIVPLGRVMVDCGRRLVTLDGAQVRLSPTQYAVLEHLAVHRDRQVPTEELLRQCWDRHRSGLVNPLPPVLSTLRTTFRGVLRFESVRGVGVTVVPSPDEAAPNEAAPNEAGAPHPWPGPDPSPPGHGRP